LIFVPAFVITEIRRKHPFVNLRLLWSRNLGAASVIGFVLGLALYGTIYLIPLYLGEVHGYNPLQIGEVLIWVGLPQLLIFPMLPFLLKRFDMRLLVAFGCLLFALSCYMNSGMSLDYEGPQFILANIVRSIGQPFTIVPVTSLATGMLSKEQSGDGSAIFNILRNLGGSVGIAILSTVVTRREQFHDSRLGESITAFSDGTQMQLKNATAQFMAGGSDPTTASAQAVSSLKGLVQRDANIMSFNDAFLFVAICLIAGTVLVWICKRPTHSGGMSAH
jgi:DHA2 family multidrug resistance protein